MNKASLGDRRLLTILEAAHDLIIVLDGAGAYREIYTSEHRHLARPAEELLTGTIHDFLPAEDAAAIQKVLDRVIEEGELVSLDYPLNTQEGTLWFSARVSSIDLEGERCALWIAREITERKQIEEALQRSEMMTAALLRAFPDRLYRLGPDGRVAERWVHSRVEPGDGFIEQEFDSEISALVLRHVAVALERCEPQVFEFTDGRQRTYEGRVELGTGDSDVLFIVRDVTSRRRAQRERAELMARIEFERVRRLESLGVLAGGIAHDFNNLLVGVLGNAEVAKRNMSAEAPAHAELNAIVRSAEDARALCRQMLAYAGLGNLSTEPVSLNLLIEELTPVLQVCAGADVELSFDLDASTPPVEADPALLRQVLMNLVTNGAEAMKDGGRVIVRSRSGDDRRVTIEVVDRGEGMSPEVRRRVLEPFFSTKFAGRGLGMAAVSGIVRAHGGDIEIDSVEGRGTTVRVRLPVEGRPERCKVSTEGAGGGGVVLVVDDEEVVRLVAKKMLELMGFDVRLAQDGDSACEILEREGEGVTLALLDLILPGRTGAQILTDLRRIRPDLPVLVTSGYGAEQLSLGLNEPFIQKPWTADELADKIHAVLASYTPAPRKERSP